ncbi:MAG: TolC family protein [Gemmatimonadaceae bacterium]
MTMRSRAGVALRLAVGAVFFGATAAPAVAQRDSVLVPTHPITIGEAARIAARRGVLAQSAIARAEQAEARVTQRRAELLPSLSASDLQAGRTFNTATFGIPFPGFPPGGAVIGPVNTVDVRGRASQTLLDVGAFQRVRSARASAEALRTEASSAAEQSAAAAAGAYVRAARARAQLSARVADSVLADSLLDIARAQLRAGVGVGLDVTRAQSQLSGTRAQLIVARNERDRAQLDLVHALGLPLDAPLLLADTLAFPAADSMPGESQAVALALRNRPDLRAADEQLRAAQVGINAIRAERLPTVALFGDEGWIGLGYTRLLRTYDWGLQLSLPLFDGFRREGRVAEQEALAREIDVRRRDLREQAATDIRGALLDLASAREQLGAASERLRLARQELAQAQERFRAGVAGNADVITASLSLNSARTLVVDALSAYQSARISLARAEGGITSLP